MTEFAKAAGAHHWYGDGIGDLLCDIYVVRNASKRGVNERARDRIQAGREIDDIDAKGDESARERDGDRDLFSTGSHPFDRALMRNASAPRLPMRALSASQSCGSQLPSGVLVLTDVNGRVQEE